MYSLLHTTAEANKPSFSFYEEKLLNRDSGTDSPTCCSYDDQNIYSLMQTLGNEHGSLIERDETDNTGWPQSRQPSKRSTTSRSAGRADQHLSKQVIIDLNKNYATPITIGRSGFGNAMLIYLQSH